MLRTQATGKTPIGTVFNNGVSTNGSPVITGLTFTAAQIKPGYWCTISKGFPSTTQRYEIIATNPGAGSITIERNANSSQTGIDVTTQAEMYTDGDGGAYARTVLEAKDRNRLQEELVNVIVSAGLTLDSSDHAQLWQSIISRLGGTIVSPNALLVDLIQRSGGSTSHIKLGSSHAWLDTIITGLTGGKLQCDWSTANSFILKYETANVVIELTGGGITPFANSSFPIIIVNASTTKTHQLQADSVVKIPSTINLAPNNTCWLFRSDDGLIYELSRTIF